MTTVEMISFAALVFSVVVALCGVWAAVNRKIETMEAKQADHRLEVIRGFASIGHFEKLEMKIDRLIDKIEKMGLALASHSRASSNSRAAEAR